MGPLDHRSATAPDAPCPPRGATPLNAYLLLLLGAGVLVLLTAWLPMLLKEAPLSLPIACVAIGAAVFGLLPVPFPAPDPAGHRALAEHLTELVVTISLTGAGLKIDRPLAFRTWAVTWRLLGPGMLLTIALLAGLAHLVLGLGAAAAVLLGALLAPTDPVLASDVQVGPPRSGEEDEVRFALTSEAGLNDGLAFPFVLLAVMLAGGDRGGEGWWGWFAYAVLWKVAAGVSAGWLLGRGLAWLVFHMPNRAKSPAPAPASSPSASPSSSTPPPNSPGATASSRSSSPPSRSAPPSRGHGYHGKLHDFAEELERLLMMALLVLLGGAVAVGGLLAAVDGGVVLYALLADPFVARPLCCWLALSGAGARRRSAARSPSSASAASGPSTTSPSPSATRPSSARGRSGRR